MATRILTGDCRAVLATLPAESVHCVVTSPPYFNLRSYLPADHPDKALEIGLETTPSAFVAAMVEVFREVWRVLRDDGVVWLNIGDSYAGSGGAQGRGGPPSASSTLRGNGHVGGGPKIKSLSKVQIKAAPQKLSVTGSVKSLDGLKPKDLMLIPARVAIALQDDGWYVRRDVIWHKPNPMPESVTDRPSTAHEYVWMLTKSQDYFYDAVAIEETVTASSISRLSQDVEHQVGSDRANAGRKTNGKMKAVGGATRNARSVWTVATRPYAGAHFATMPADLADICIKAGTSEAGACAHCGVPLERIIEKGEIDLEAAKRCGANAYGAYHGKATKNYVDAAVQDPSAVKARILEGMRPKITVGWEKPCDCLWAPPVPCTVLDPFGGAGTTALAADRLRRDAILIELNAEYAAQAQTRLREESPLFSSITSEAPLASRPASEVVAE